MISENQISAQLYTVREHLSSLSEISNTLKKIRKIGYRAVELAGLHNHRATEWHKLLKDSGLVCCSIHVPLETLKQLQDGIIENIRQIGCEYVICPYPTGVSFDNLSSVKELTKCLNKIGKRFRQAGITFAYHNHNIEFLKTHEITWLEYIYNETDPQYVKGQLDVYWVQAGGGNPEAWCKKLDKRLPTIHLKDFGVGGQNQPVFKELGEGNLDWLSIIRAAKSSGCEWYIVEMDGNWIDANPFHSLKNCYDYLRDSVLGG